MTHRSQGFWGCLLTAGVLLTAAACADPTTASDAASTPESTTATLPQTKADPAVEALVPAELKQKGVLVLATNAPYAPLEYFKEDNQTLTGYDIDLGNAIGAAMGLKTQWKNISFDSIIPGLQAGKYDGGMAGFSIEHERLGTVDFVSYYLSGGGFLIKKGSGIKIGGFGDLCGYRVAVQKGVSQVDALVDHSKECVAQGKKPITINQIPDQNVVVLSLASGRADVVVGDKPQVEYAAGHAEGVCVSSTYQTSHSIAGIAVPKGHKELTTALQASVNHLIQNGDLAQISKVWNVGVPVSGTALTADYQKLSAPWGVGPDGTVNKSLVFTDPAAIRPGHTYYYQPIHADCS
ncbi:polar amino acid transport system substrate-binding protein [Kribbella aluminosa]|uniref:Polar amino acid transport system substrate-binding protein n=1 Tax=Kribbella aluminosa TaxID=416017 RepID=A0ABS4UFV7_9ACTN|nr:ABC transporter substrate-binding protein [Kribbella aluminosa]MBP2350543.1 polar amino acid transport system substrate-binding protein [Kribbella aluminosa]